MAEVALLREYLITCASNGNGAVGVTPYPYPMLESAVEQVFARRVRDLGGLSFKLAPLHVGNPDRIVLLDGHVYLVELKAEGGKLAPAQVLWHRRAAKTGNRVYVVTGSSEARIWVP